MRVLVALVGGFVLVAMLVAPSQPAIRDWRLAQACPELDEMSRDICAPIRCVAGVPERT